MALTLRKRLKFAVQLLRSGPMIGPLVNDLVRVRGQQVHLLDEHILAALYDSNWVPAKICDLPSQRIGNRWRVLDDSDGEVTRDVGVLREQEEELNVVQKLTTAHTTARLFGSALLVVVTGENTLDTPINFRALRPGDVKRLMIVNRYRVSWDELEANYLDPNFGLPKYWRISQQGLSMLVHPSRVWHFKSKPEPEMDSPVSISSHDFWGKSILAPLMREVNADEVISDAVQFLTNEASLLIAKIPNLTRFALRGKTEGDTVTTIDQLAEKMNSARSVRRMVFTDASTTLERLAVQFVGLPKIMEEYALRTSGAADIPATIFWGRSPAGENATGVADFWNFDEMINAIRRWGMDPALRFLTPFLLANGGVVSDRQVTWTWPSVLNKDQKLEAETLKLTVEAVLMLVERGIITADEARQILDGNPILGRLPGEAPESAADVDDYMAALAELGVSMNGNSNGQAVVGDGENTG